MSKVEAGLVALVAALALAQPAGAYDRTLHRFTRTYFGISVYDGSLPYNGTLVTPSWGGSMFEALMPSLFVPEERWAPGS